MKLWIDTETRSRLKLTPGVFKYSTEGEVTVITWAADDGPVSLLETTDHIPAPRKLIEALLFADEIWCAGDEFDRTMLNTQPWFKQLEIPISKWRCLQAKARAHGLPGGLDQLCRILGVPADEAKDVRGKALIQLFCKPNKDGNYNDKHSHPIEWDEFCEYAKQDIVAMRACWKLIPGWNMTPFETRLRTLDAVMNARGVRMDLELCEAAIKITTRAKARLADETDDLTIGEVARTTQRNKLLKHLLEAYGVELPDLTADTVERRLNDPELPEPVKELLRNRQESSKASTAKYKRVMSSNIEGRLYGLLVYCGASRTGRWAGRLWQPHNLMRPTISRDQIELSIDAFKADDEDLLDLLGTGHMEVAANLMRSIPIAAPGHKLVVADLANIEGRGLAWMAGEEWKLQAFREYDAKTGPDLYKLSYARSFNIDPADVTDAQRQVGKVQELALGYYGGVGAFISMSEVYRVDLDEMAATAWGSLSRHAIAEATADWHKAVKKKRTFGLIERTWVVCQVFVRAWRRAHPATMDFHEKIAEAVVNAIGTPRRQFKVRGFTVDRIDNWLRIRCPSGSYLCYPAPRYNDDKREISYLGVDPYTRQWRRIPTYSGKLTQNLDERISRDVLANGLLDAESENYRPLLTVHDEIICEPIDSPQWSATGLCNILTRPRTWSVGLPLAAKGFESYRYRKD